MSIKEELAQAKSELVSLKDGVSAGDDEAIARASELMDSVIPALEEQVEKAAEAAELIKSFGNIEQEESEEVMEETPKSIGEAAVKAFAGNIKSGERFSIVAPEVKTDPTFISTVQQLDYDKKPVQVLHPTRIADLFGKETISGNALTFYRITDKNGGVGTTSEGGLKNQIDFTSTPVTVALTKITGFLKETEELVEDTEWLANGMQDRLLNKLAICEEAQLLVGNGTAPNMTGVLNTSGIGSITYASPATISADDLFKAAMKVKSDSEFDADAIILNPSDYQTFRLAKDSNNQYYGGGYFGGAYGNGGLTMVPPIWGIPTYLSTNITAGQALVGAFKQGASVVSKGGLRIEATNTDQDDFVKNLVTIRAEKREVLAVRYPCAFVKVSQAQ